LAVFEVRREDDLSAALEVERELGGPPPAPPDGTGRVEADEQNDDAREPAERPPGLPDRRATRRHRYSVSVGFLRGARLGFSVRSPNSGSVESAGASTNSSEPPRSAPHTPPA